MRPSLRALGHSSLFLILVLAAGCFDSMDPLDQAGDLGDNPAIQSGGDPTAGDSAGGDSTGPGEEPIDELPPVPAPPTGTVVYEENFEGDYSFAHWKGRNVRRNLRVIEQQDGLNHLGRLVYRPNSDWRVSFLPRFEGAFDVITEFSIRFPAGYSFIRYPEGSRQAGQIIGGGKHVWMLLNTDIYADSRQVVRQDGVVRLDFSAPNEFGAWSCTSYRDRPGGGRPGEIKKRFAGDPWFIPGRWHRVRCELHLNREPGNRSGLLLLWIDGEHRGTFGGEFNVVGAAGGIRTLGFGNMDNLQGEPWMDIDDLRVEVPFDPLPANPDSLAPVTPPRR